MTTLPPREEDEVEGRVLAVHLGQSANCSSVGSVVDLLFVSSVVGGAILAALAVLTRDEANVEVRAAQEGEPTGADAGADAKDDARQG